MHLFLFQEVLSPLYLNLLSSCCCTYIHTYLIYPIQKKPFSQNETRRHSLVHIDSLCVLISTFRHLPQVDQI
ncbi:unnamed protein product [Lactuca virosa]|uniref:Uncharacterized protein n=1 Tax=Lactuca virosa TaxID=75947 RepID=A0AAU9NDD6_9ASTR|nr:unnamed protein product [Lactuca virosa]